VHPNQVFAADLALGYLAFLVIFLGGTWAVLWLCGYFKKPGDDE
jgi:hypothetical protein